MPYGASYQTDAQGNPVRDAQGRILYTNTPQQAAQAAVAPMSGLQQQALAGLGAYVQPQQGSAASQIAADVAGRTAAGGYYSPLVAERFQLGSPQQVRTDSFTAPFVSQAYMSPYMQNVVQAQQREARRASDIMRNQQQAQAVGAGAFGGSRQAIVEAERQRNLATQLGDIQAQGLQQAYGQGMGQFNTEQQAYLAAQQANQQANLQAAIQNQQAQQAAQQLQEQSRQFGAGLGIQGYGQTLQAAQLLGQQGGQEFQQDLAALQAKMQAGGMEQQQQQQVINQAIQNYATQQQYPYLQLGIMSNMLRGLPMQAGTTSMYQAQPMGVQQLVGTAGALYNMGKAGAFKEGGEVKMAKGGIASGLSSYELEPMTKKLGDQQLQMKLQDPETDAETKGIMQAEADRRSYARRNMAGGGAIAFAKGEEVDDKNPFDKDKEKPKSAAAPTPKPKKGETATEKATTPDYTGQIMSAIEPQMAKLREVGDEEKKLQGILESEKVPSVQEAVAEQAAARKAAGVDTGAFERMRGQQQSLLDQATSNVEKQKYMRLAQAWATFGSTPGPLLKAGLMAINKYAEELIDDDKELSKVKKDIAKSMQDIDLADYNEKAGMAKEGLANRKDSFNRVVNIATKLADIRATRESGLLKAQTEGITTGKQLEAGEKLAHIKGKYDLAEKRIAAAARGETGSEAMELKHNAAADRERARFEKRYEDQVKQARVVMANAKPDSEAYRNAKTTIDEYEKASDQLEERLSQQYKYAQTFKRGEGEKPKQESLTSGMVVDGYRFKGGNPNDKSNWEKVK
jgi:hypothetical protein